MAQRGRNNGKKESGLKEETKHTIIAIVFIVVAIFLFIASRGTAGIVGDAVYRAFHFLFGTGYYLVPVILLLVGISFFRALRPRVMTMNIVGGMLFLISGLGLVEIIFKDRTGGIIGWGVNVAAEKLLGGAAAFILGAIFIISIIVIFDTRLTFGTIAAFFKRKRKSNPLLEENEEDFEDDEDLEPEEDEDDDLEPEEDEEEVIEEDEEEFDDEEEGDSSKDRREDPNNGNGDSLGGYPDLSLVDRPPYEPPPLSILGKDTGKPQAGDIKATSNIIKRTLANFGIEVEMDEVSVGPSITRYALKPAEGVKLSRIVGLQNDLSLALAAHPLRVEAPIPGKSLVGIEVPNSTKTTIRLGSLLKVPDFKDSEKPLLVTLGKGISGTVHFSNLSKMPHVLIAGTTGSGKSVAIHTIITSLLYRNGPENLRFIMVDPKRVELTLYNNIPHLLTPVITNAKKTILALKWAAKEMDRRYDILEAESVRDISSYHQNVLGPALEEYNEKLEDGGLGDDELDKLQKSLPEPMPYIVVVIDELADIMSTYPRELEAAIVRIAQMSRAVGIHLVLSTQRPSTEVITGLIKANIPARIALQVPSQIDSRTIIDMPGAEKLLGAGDMLYLGSEMSKPQRLQSAFISEEEVKKVVKAVISKNPGMETDGELEITEGNGESASDDLFGDSLDNGASDDDDELYEEAREIVIQMKKASSSLLQRKLKVGYARAARLIDMLEERGVVGPAEGAKPREVYQASEAKGKTASDEFADEFDRNNTDDDEIEEED